MQGKNRTIAIFVIFVMLFAACSTHDFGMPEAPAQTVMPSYLPIETPTTSAETLRERTSDDGREVIYIAAFSSGSLEIEESFSNLQNAVGSHNITNPVFLQEQQ